MGGVWVARVIDAEHAEYKDEDQRSGRADDGANKGPGEVPGVAVQPLSGTGVRACDLAFADARAPARECTNRPTMLIAMPPSAPARGTMIGKNPSMPAGR